MTKLKEICYRILELFCGLRFCERDRELVRFKAILLFTLLEGGVLFAVGILVEIVAGWRPLAHLSKNGVALAFLFLVVTNHQLLFRPSEWRLFKAKFRHEPPELHRRGTALAVAIVVAVISSVVLSFIALGSHRAGR